MKMLLVSHKRRRLLLAGLLVVLSGVLPYNGFAAEPIRFGVTASLSGPYKDSGTELLQGLQMWAHDVNARGALLGRPVEIVFYDDESDPETSARLYEKLITEDKVDLLVGPYTSDLTLAASTVAERHGIPMVSGSASASNIWSRGYRNIFQVDAPAREYMDLLLESASDAGLSSVALVYADSDFPRAVASGVRAKAAELGMKLVFDAQYPAADADFSDLAARIKASDPDLVIGGTYLDDSIALVRAAKQQQLSPKGLAFTTGPALPQFGDQLGADAEGVLGVVSWMRSGRVPMAYDFSFRYKEIYGRNAAQQAAYGYAAGQVLEAAVRLANTLDPEAVRQQLRDMRFRSILGNYRVDAAGNQLAKDTYVMQWQHGERLLVLPRDIRDAPIIFPFTSWTER